MKRFAQLFGELDSSTATSAKVAALRRYFDEAADADAAWAVYFLSGGKPRQVVSTAVLCALACRRAGIAEWLFEECYQAVGDLAETIAHVLPPAPQPSDVGLAQWVEQRLLPLREMPVDAQAERIASYWDELDTWGRFLLTKLIGGGFRVGVSKLLVQRALAEHAGLDAKVVAQRMMGFTDKTARPNAAAYRELVSAQALRASTSGKPYPFFLAHAVDVLPDVFHDKLGPPDDWLVEWKYDGIRAQIVKRAGQVWVWSRGEELMTERFPEVVALAEALSDGTVLDGEILVWKDGRPAPFSLLQQRIGRKTLTKRVLAEAPATFIAYDLLEWHGEDVRGWPQARRRGALLGAAQASAITVSPVEVRSSWSELALLREESRGRGVEGFMLKHREARYGTGRTKAGGTWWKWKIDPHSVDAVLIYAQAGHGRRASVYTDYTFAVWNRTPRDAAEAQAAVDVIAAREPPRPDALQLVSFAKAYSGLSDEEFREVDRIIRQTTLEKFGPVRSVKPTLVFELGFEGINRSTRHKSGIAVRFPRMLRIRRDKPLHEADSLQTLEGLLQG
ncbi:ATP-dependent DNA ligase [Piscinibacter sp.]|uniref:ATP-dependent DNA ligase n=1 Tax=Piscinibacter sp. TaxID=1903157 RepID=UPI002C86C7CA|nr:ATP-dependent DNA ligase [Albitalea sp.]HUG21864.1 ATP-dependent DNA ligase [Albitalea sp.]